MENRLIREVENLGGQALKFNSSKRGMPDRIVLMPGGNITFVEMKAPGERPRPLQEKRMRDLKELSFPVAVIDSLQSLEKFIDNARWCILSG